MDDNFANDARPHNPDFGSAGSPSAPMVEGSFVSSVASSAFSPPDTQVLPHAQARMLPSATSNGITQHRAPWEDGIDESSPQAPASPPQPTMPPPPAAPAPTHQSPSVPSPIECDTLLLSPGTDSVGGRGAAAAAVPSNPGAPANKPVSSTAYDTLQRQIANRTVATDAATKRKEAEVTAAAQEFVKHQKASREKEVTDARARHKQEQQTGANMIEEYRRSGAVWSAVGMLVDLQKPNPCNKNTERMRSVLTALDTKGHQRDAAATIAK